jgi:hypothetical protein
MRSFACGIVLAIAAAAGCAGDAPKDTSCKGVLYDPCRAEHDCSNMNCLPFAGGFSACTQACTVGDNSTCPKTANGMTVTCNANAVCEPPEANSSCKLP